MSTPRTGVRRGPIVLVASRGFGLWSGRRELIERLVAREESVLLVAAPDEYLDRCAALGARCVPVVIDRTGSGGGDAAVLRTLMTLYRAEQPSVIVHYNSKPVLLGSLAALTVPSTRVINVITGFGRALDGAGPRRLVAHLLYGLAGRRAARTVFQNSDDAQYAATKRLVPSDRATTIVSSGVDIRRFAPVDAPATTATRRVLLVSRLLWSKGIREFVHAAAAIGAQRPEVRFVIGGEFDHGHADAVPEAWIREQVTSGVVEFIGYVSDMPARLREADVFVLPSRYREGVPRVVIEAMACAVPVVAVDAPGARDVIRDGHDGYLVPAGDVAQLTARIALLLDDPAAARAMGQLARDAVVTHFSRDSVTDRMLSLVLSDD